MEVSMEVNMKVVDWFVSALLEIIVLF